MADLDPRREELYGVQRRELMDALREILEGPSPYAARGVTGRARAETSEEAIENVLRQLGIFKAELGAGGLQREEQLADVAAARKHQIRMTASQWAQQEKAATTAFGRQKEIVGMQQQYETARASEERKRQRKQFITQALVSTAMGAGIGALAPGAMGVAAGTKGAGWAGAGRGALMGGPASGQMLAMYPWMQSLTQQPTQPTQPAISGRQYPAGSFESWLETMFPYYKGAGAGR